MSLFNKFQIIFGQNFRKINLKVFLVSLLQIIVELFSIAFLIPLIQYLSSPESIENYHELIIQFFNLFIINKSIPQILIFLIILYFVKTIILILINNFLLNYSKYLQYFLARDLLVGYMRSPINFILKRNSSVYVRNIYGETNDVVSRYMQFVNLVLELIILTLILVISFSINSLFTLSVMVIFSLLGSFYYFFLKNYIAKLGKQRLEASSYKLKTVNELFDNFEFIKLTGKFSVFSDFFNKINLIFLTSIKKISLIDRIPRFLFEPVLIFFLLVNYYSSVTLNLSNSQILQNLLIFLVLCLRIIPSINRILSSSNKLRFGKYTINAIYNEIVCFKKYSKKNIKEINLDNTLSKKYIFENIFFKNVSFYFDKKDETIFEKINLKIGKKDKVAIVGPNGSGKTTLLKLLLGFYTPNNGKVFFGKKNLSVNRYLWQKTIGYVPQKTLLLDESILFNITLDRNVDIKDNKHLKKIFEISSLNDFVSYSNLKQKIGERGSKISGGQAQRISIARALYNKPTTLILDEPTANLDRNTGVKILKNIKNYFKNSRIIIVTHNEKDLFICNKIFKITDKKIKLYEK
jgi:ATP-binding cassette, subfamily B, bacterial PglK